MYFEDKCKIPELKTPLYQENCLREFSSESEKSEARRSLGIFTRDDVMSMSLFTVEDGIPSKQQLLTATLKKLNKGGNLFLPYTSFNAVLDSSGESLTNRLQAMRDNIAKHNEEFSKLYSESNSETISSLADVRKFLSGFKNGQTLYTTIDTMDKNMLRFKSTGKL